MTIKREFRHKWRYFTYCGQIKIGTATIQANNEVDVAFLLEFMADYMGVYTAPWDPPDTIEIDN